MALIALLAPFPAVAASQTHLSPQRSRICMQMSICSMCSVKYAILEHLKKVAAYLAAPNHVLAR